MLILQSSKSRIVCLLIYFAQEVLSGLYVLLSLANVAELSQACGRVFHHILESE